MSLPRCQLIALYVARLKRHNPNEYVTSLRLMSLFNYIVAPQTFVKSPCRIYYNVELF